METGVRFLRSQVDNAVAQHGLFMQSLIDHESQAEDQRMRDLCARHVPHMRLHQRMLEELQRQLGGASEVSLTGAVKKLAGTALGIAKDLADAPRESDFLRLVEDVVLARQAEDTFKTFREAGRALGIRQLAEVGEIGERHHDAYVKEANRLVQAMFIEHAGGAEGVIPSAAAEPDVRT